MLDFARSPSSVIHCYADSSALDALRGPEGAMIFRVAREELVCLSAPAAGNTVLEALSARLARADPHALCLDRSDAWAVFTLMGPECAGAFSRLGAIPLQLPPAFLQGAIAGVPAKAIVLRDRIHLLVSSVLGDHLRNRILEACHDLEVREGSPAPFAAVEAPVNA